MKTRSQSPRLARAINFLDTVTASAIGILLLAFVIPAAQAQTFTVLHYFTGGQDGGNPVAGLTMDASGNLYGSTEYGGNPACFSGGYSGCGTAFKFSLHGSDWVLTPLYTFAGSTDGAHPLENLTIATDGSLYGTTSAGGIGQCSAGNNGCGTVFHLRPAPDRCRTVICVWDETVLYQFTGGNDGGNPQSNVLFDSAGNLYGTTYQGGASGSGVAFELTPSEGGWTESVLHAFAGGTDGAFPEGNLIADSSGNLDGTTELGGGCGGECGTVFRLTPSGSSWQESILYSFQGQSDGDYPVGGVTIDSAGNLYGSNNGDNGLVFELMFSHGSWNLVPLYGNLGFGGLPAMTNPPIVDAAGNLYGTTVFGGGSGCPYGCGEVFKLTPTVGGWTFTVLHEFDYADGQAPWGRLVMDSRGNLYGTTVEGGIGNCPGLCGTVWEITP